VCVFGSFALWAGMAHCKVANLFLLALELHTFDSVGIIHGQVKSAYLATNRSGVRPGFRSDPLLHGAHGAAVQELGTGGVGRAEVCRP
jgi:hypothetical protein